MEDKIKKIENMLEESRDDLKQVEDYFKENGCLEYIDSPNETFEQGWVNALEWVLGVLK